MDVEVAGKEHDDQQRYKDVKGFFQIKTRFIDDMHLLSRLKNVLEYS